MIIIIYSQVIILNPIKNVVTRWNSTFFVLERLLKLYESIELLIRNLSNDPNRDYRNDGKTLGELFLTIDEWIAVKKLVKILKPFANATKILSGSTYPTLNIVYPIIINLIKKLEGELLEIDDLEVKNVTDIILEQINYRWHDPGMAALATTFLDPRFKGLNFLTHMKKNEVHNYVHNLILKYCENNNQYQLNDIEKNSGRTKSDLSLFFEEVSVGGK
jgi:hypothetical protein